MKRTKRLAALALCLIMLVSCLPFAAYCDTNSVKNNSITNSRCALTISGINSTSSASIQTASSMSLSIKMELQKLKSGTYSTIETWTASKTGTVITMNEDRLINVLSTYRLKVTFNAGNETIIRYAYN